jgi:hypothetical protein
MSSIYCQIINLLSNYQVTVKLSSYCQITIYHINQQIKYKIEKQLLNFNLFFKYKIFKLYYNIKNYCLS